MRFGLEILHGIGIGEDAVAVEVEKDQGGIHLFQDQFSHITGQLMRQEDQSEIIKSQSGESIEDHREVNRIRLNEEDAVSDDADQKDRQDDDILGLI